MTLLTLVRGVLCLLLSFSCWSFAAQPSQALSDEQALVVDVWRLVNEAYVDPSFTGVPWRKLRQKALEKSIQTPSDAYSAIDAMLAPFLLHTSDPADESNVVVPGGVLIIS